MSIARLFADHLLIQSLKQKNMNNTSQATTSSIYITATQQQEAMYKKEEQTTQQPTQAHYSNNSANGRQASSNKTVRKQLLTANILTTTSILSVLTLLYSCFIMPYESIILLIRMNTMPWKIRYSTRFNHLFNSKRVVSLLLNHH